MLRPSRTIDLQRRVRTLTVTLFALASPLLAPPRTGAGLLAFYPFEGNANDASSHANHGTVTGAVLTDLGYEGQAYEFSGASSYISIPVNINPSAIPRLTMGAWARVDSVSSIGTVISHDNGNFDRTLDTDSRGAGSGYRYSAFTGSTVVSAGPDPAPIGQWVFVAARYDDVADKLTLDVGPDRVTVSANPAAGHATTRIGGNPSYGEYFDGRIDNVFVFDELLSDARIDAIREGGAAGVLGELSITGVAAGPGPNVRVQFVAFPPALGTLYRLETAETALGPWATAVTAHLDELAPFRYEFTVLAVPLPASAAYRVVQTVP